MVAPPTVQSIPARLRRILIADARGAPMRDCRQVEAIAGEGLAGDRYRNGRGTFSGRAGVHAGEREVSLIAASAISRCNARLGSALDAAALRRNLVVEGLELADLGGRVLAIGDVRLQLLGTAPPCRYLVRLLGVDVMRGLHGVGGRRAAIVASGRLHTGMAVQLLPVDGMNQRARTTI